MERSIIKDTVRMIVFGIVCLVLLDMVEFDITLSKDRFNLIASLVNTVSYATKVGKSVANLF